MHLLNSFSNFIINICFQEPYDDKYTSQLLENRCMDPNIAKQAFILLTKLFQQHDQFPVFKISRAQVVRIW